MNNDEQEFIKDNPVIPVKFTPKNSGSYSRFMQRDTIKAESSNALEQTLGIKVGEKAQNANTPYYQGQVDFPQPSVVGFGKVTSAGAKSTPFLSDRWTVAKNSSGNYTITHNLGFTNYVPIVTASDTASRTICVSGETSTKFDVETYTDAGTQTDTAFNFIVYIQ
jgi:hypothetical protein